MTLRQELASMTLAVNGDSESGGGGGMDFVVLGGVSKRNAVTGEIEEVQVIASDSLSRAQIVVQLVNSGFAEGYDSDGVLWSREAHSESEFAYEIMAVMRGIRVARATNYGDALRRLLSSWTPGNRRDEGEHGGVHKGTSKSLDAGVGHRQDRDRQNRNRRTELW